MAEPPVKPKARFQFELRHLIWATMLLAASMGMFGVWGIPVALYLLAFWWSVFVRRRKAKLLAARLQAGSRDLSSFTLPNMLGVFGSMAVLIVLLMVYFPVVSRDSCYYNLLRLSTALQAYRNLHGAMPPVYVVDNKGRPAHSWRVIILPQLGHQNLFDQYRFNEPWDSAHNRKLLEETPWEYRCRDRRSPFGRSRPLEPGMTTYLAVTGNGVVWPNAIPETSKEPTASRDWAALVIDAEFQPVPWTKPEDFSIEDVSRLVDPPPSIDQGHWRRGFLWSTYHGRRVIWANEGAHDVGFTPPCEVGQLKELLTVGASKPGRKAEYLDVKPPLIWRRIHYTNIARLVICLVAAVWPIVWMVGERR